jgi:membrane protein implicated in regulation of membrane protease activity
MKRSKNRVAERRRRDTPPPSLAKTLFQLFVDICVWPFYTFPNNALDAFAGVVVILTFVFTAVAVVNGAYAWAVILLVIFGGCSVITVRAARRIRRQREAEQLRREAARAEVRTRLR